MNLLRAAHWLLRVDEIDKTSDHISNADWRYDEELVMTGEPVFSRCLDSPSSSVLYCVP
jgi:hypothetical protein